MGKLAVIHADPKLVVQFVADARAVGLDIVAILHVLGLRQRLAVHIDDAVLDLERLTWQTQAALHIVVTTVDRTVYDVTEDLFIVIDHVVAILQAQGIVVGVGTFQRHGVTSREVKHHDIHALDIAQALQSVVIKLRALNIGLAIQDGQHVLSQREVQRRLRHAGAIGHLVDPQEIARQ